MSILYCWMSIRADMKSYAEQDMKSNSTQLEHASRSRTSNIILEMLAERVRCTKSHSEYLLPSR